MEEEKNAAKEAFDATAFAQLLFGPRGRQTRAIFLAFGIPGDHGYRTQGGMNPSDELQAPIGGIQTNKARADCIQMHGPCQERTREGSIMDIGGGQEKKEWQARTTADERMDAIATQERTRMLGRSMAISSIGISAVRAVTGAAFEPRLGTCPHMKYRHGPSPRSRLERRPSLRWKASVPASGNAGQDALAAGS